MLASAEQFRGNNNFLITNVTMRALTTKAKLISQTHPTLNFAHPSLESFIWNTIIRAHAQSRLHSPLSIFQRMRSHNVNPDFHTFPFLLHSLSSPHSLPSGKQVHTQSLLFGFSNDPFVQTSLINMYSGCGQLGFARQVFDEIPNPDLPSWNSVINAVVRVGLDDVARGLFDRMPVRNVISWSCMINGYVKWGKYRSAIGLFKEMLEVEEGDRVRPNEFTMSVVLSACGGLGFLEYGKWVHGYIDKFGMRVDVVLGTSLIDMYVKCGSIEMARWLFWRLGPRKDVMAWSAMISGLAMHGFVQECFDLFSSMTSSGVRPNVVTFLGVLCACVHGGMVDEGKTYFRRMSEEFGITPLIQHYGCMIDLYGRAGLMEEAWNVVKSMPMEPDVLVWGSLLSGSKMNGDIEACEAALKKVNELDPTNSGAHVLLSNVYAKTGRWTEVRRVRDQMEARGIKKVPGCSMVEVGGVVYEFFVGDNSHPESPEIHMMLDEIMKRLKMEGYVENTDETLLDLDEEGKQLALRFHSEKLAVAFCLLKTNPGTPITIVKNLRICLDCHVALKMISRVFNRKIVVRDCNRFHHFQYGLCSCRDYW